ncbi:hypothetical protein N577_000250 [Lacticaseibacillus rhamnosus 2166]|nr:hypothetical protein N577_000250 [Lacticaseibacillus rhamnosus 2166]
MRLIKLKKRLMQLEMRMLLIRQKHPASKPLMPSIKVAPF